MLERTERTTLVYALGLIRSSETRLRALSAAGADAREAAPTLRVQIQMAQAERQAALQLVKITGHAQVTAIDLLA